ncbi:ATP-binding protein [Thermoactinospora rubra]|uniref:ATP-binding protein n=1 Tax=Thermoactinospora rubra TaxID=1088767 RepID=UPI000A1190DC|nr:ATP-binding protein [Thermoactinospora rubra]
MTDTALAPGATGKADRNPAYDEKIASWAFAPHPISVSKARRFARARLVAWGLKEAAEVVELLVSELVTNALQHARGPCRLTVWVTGNLLRCDVQDGSVTPPRLRETAEDEHGRGLQILDALACCWGSESTPRGKVVWFELPLSPSTATPA